MSVASITVRVPATTANLGPGFDCIGAALTLYNRFKFSRLDAEPISITVTGVEANLVKTDESNLVYQSVVHLYKYLGQVPPPLQIEIQMGVPLARGLGSSATAIVGGLIGANWLAGSPLAQREVMELAIALEGHPDNVVPALLGGCRLAARGLTDEPQECGDRKGEAGNLGGWVICDVAWNSRLVPVVAIPNFELSTQEARQVLPTRVSLADAVFNTAHLGLLVRGLETGREDWLRAALQDRLHQRYRQELVPGYGAVQSAAMAAGAYGVVISGAGPTLLALVNEARADDVARAMAVAWNQAGMMAEVRSLPIDNEGARSY